MTLLAIFLALVCCYSLTSGCLEKSILTAPIGFTAAGMLVPLLLPGVGEWRGSLEALLRVAEIGLVLLLFTDASRTGLVYLEHASLESGKSTIQSEVMVTVLLSIFAHGLSAIPGIIFMRRRSPRPVPAPWRLEGARRRKSLTSGLTSTNIRTT